MIHPGVGPLTALAYVLPMIPLIFLAPISKITECPRMKHVTRHVAIYYFGTPPAPENIKLYDPYNNRECLHCHLGARSFEDGAVHNADPATLPAIKSNQLSCLSSGCHEMAHDISHLKDAKLWKGAK
jgi:hypothetical protein